MAITFISVSEFGLKASAEVLAHGFADYFVKIPASEAMLWAMARADSVDFSLSRVVLLDGVAVEVALVARRGWTSRLAGMALVPEARRRGVGRALVEKILSEASARGDRKYDLEVIEQNGPAVKLYETTGFVRVRRLVGFSGRVGTEASPARALREVDVREVATAITREAALNWPWQISGETIAQAAPPSLGYALDGAWVMISSPSEQQVSERALAVEGATDRSERAVNLLRTVMARHTGKE